MDSKFYMPLVSVCMISYNHEKYITEAIEGVLMQQTNFPIELIIANDASTDSSNIIINHLIKNHPKGNLINYFNHKNNMGMMPNFIFALQQCKGKYIALCEGDDYWTDSLKLQKQVDFLEDNNDYVLCFHAVNILKINGKIVDDFITKVPENYETIETLVRFGNYIHTPSVVFRNIIKKFPFEFNQSPIGDYFLYVMLSEYGKLKYLVDKMAVYRYEIGFYSKLEGIQKSKKWKRTILYILSYTNNQIVKKNLLDRLCQSLNLNDENETHKTQQILAKEKVYQFIKLFVPPIILIVKKIIFSSK